nr:MAG TPA: hypothetical protein [Caudoviricetes sp.]
MEAIKMSVAEMKLQHIVEESNLNRNKLDTTETKLDQVMSIIDNHIQNLDDTFIKTHDAETKKIAYRVVQAMTNLRKDIEAKVKEE